MRPSERTRASRRRESPFSHSSLGSVVLSATNPSDSAANLIRGMIFSGTLGPGDWLPPSRELAACLGISVLTLRVGLKSLESTGYIVTTRGHQGGSRVTEIESLTCCWLDWRHDNASEVDDMWAFREVIETKIAAVAAMQHTKSELEAIETAVSASAADNHTAILRWNDVFHDALASAAHSKHLEQAMISVRQELFLPAGLLLRIHSAAELMHAHAQIFEAVRSRDPDAAAEKMRSHLAETRVMVGMVLEEEPGAEPSYD